MDYMHKLFVILTIVALAVHGQFGVRHGQQQAQPYRLAIESQEVFLGETITFQVQVQNEKDQQSSLPAPVFPNTNDFTVVPLPPQNSTRSSISIINGKRTESHTVTTTFQYQITPKRVGTLMLPALQVTTNGKTYQTQQVPIRVLPPEKLDDLKLTTTLSSEHCFVGEALTITWRWEVGRDIRSFQFSLPILESDSLHFPEVEPQIDRSRLNEYIEIPVANGNRFIGKRRQGAGGRIIIEFSCPAIAKRSGTIPVPPAVVICNVTDERANAQRQRRGSLFDDDFFFGRSVPTRRISVQSNETSLEIRELPVQGKSKSFSGIVGKCTVSCQADPLEVSVGDPIQLKITLQGPEYLEHIRLPNLADQQILQRQFKIGSDDEPGVITGNKKVFNRILRAKNSNITAIPPIEISYFDSQSGSYETASSEAIPIKVQPSKTITAQDAEGLQFDNAPAQAMTSQVKQRQGGLANNYSVEELLVNQQTTNGKLIRSPLGIAILVICPLLYALVCVIAYLRTLADPVAKTRRRAKGICLRSLKQAKNLDDVLNAIRQFLGDKLGRNPEALTFGDVDEPLQQAHIDQDTWQNLKNLFNECEASRYAGNASIDLDDAKKQAESLVANLEDLLK
ncbi:MAG: protein BatD [Lentisphaerae bacterium]|jgi:hypothetical protein|nr:protein BatD [Lentisphaerota bacterium]